MIRLNSLFRAYDAHVSCDPAIRQAPAAPTAPLDDASAEDIEAHAKAVAAHEKAAEEYAATLLACHETGEWEPLLIPGETPLKFVLQHVDGEAYRWLIDRSRLPEGVDGHVGEQTARALLVRLALADVVGVDGIKVRREPDPKWNNWTMAQPEIVKIFDSADPRIVNELGLAIHRRATLSSKR